MPDKNDKISAIVSGIITAKQLLELQIKNNNVVFRILLRRKEQEFVDQFYLQLHTSAQRIFQWRKFYLWCRLLRNKQILNIELMDNYKEMLSFFLPEGVLDYFDCKSVRVVDSVITIRLEEKNCIPETATKHQGKEIVSKGFRDFSVEDFPVRGKKVNLLVRRRVWKIEGVKELLKRDIPITFPNTKLQKEFAVFLKGGNRKRAGGNLTSSKNL